MRGFPGFTKDTPIHRTCHSSPIAATAWASLLLPGPICFEPLPLTSLCLVDSFCSFLLPFALRHPLGTYCAPRGPNSGSDPRFGGCASP
eukprot:60623-Rhodomonas_salina.2